ncbi:MAG: SDR family NAD(P)-dependent oxidoreductase [Saprospiraceae bacterium]|nr:SDR family NAD(P)-dependent oxidoreductase [Saprospiraceae bacterium]
MKKIVLITGATSGIGKATARLLAQSGYRLILTGRREDRLQQMKEEMESLGAECRTLCYDVRSYEACSKALESLPEDWQAIDVLLNNAGKAKGFDPIQEGQLTHWEEMIDTNLKGLLYMTRLISPGMVERHSGHIVNIASTAGKEVYPNGNVYCATKFGVDALTQAMRIDLFKHNIRVSQVAPGHVEETEFAEVRFDGDKERAKIYQDFNPLTSRDVAETILFIITRPPHVNIQDVLMMGTQQASSNFIDRSGRQWVD